MGKEGKKPCGKVEEGAAAASGPGMETTDQSADGVGLTTSASSPMAGRQVNEKAADTINPNATRAGPTEPVDRSLGPAVEPEPPRQESETTSQDRTPSSKDASGGEVHELATGDKVEGGETDDEDRRAHERIDDESSQVEMSEDETTTTTPHAPQSTLLKGQWTGQASGGINKPTAPETTSKDHPDEDGGPTNPTRLSSDPGDATGDDERRPDTPTDPPDQSEGTRGRGGEERVESSELRVSRAPNDVQEGLGENIDEECRPRRPGEPPNEARNPTDVQVEPGGKTGEVKRNGCTAHDDADAEVDGEVADTHRDVQNEVESMETRWEASTEGECWSATTHERSSMEAVKNDQRTSMNVNDVPEDPPDPPLTSPDEPTRPENEPPSVELEGERRRDPSCDDGSISAEATASGELEGDEDPRNRPKAAQNKLDRVRERLEQRDEENSPGRTQDEPDAPGDEADASRSMETGRGNCGRRQNASKNTRSTRMRQTHQVDLERSQTSRAAKRPYQATSTRPRNDLGTSATSALMKWTHHLETETPEATEASRGSRKSSRAFRTAPTLSTVPDTMGHSPWATGTRAAAIRNRQVEIDVQEAG